MIEMKRDIGHPTNPKRGAVQRYDRHPLTWWPLLPDTATFMCSNGHFGRLDDHQIADDGTVTPSVVCPVQGCDFHKDIKLMDWKRLTHAENVAPDLP